MTTYAYARTARPRPQQPETDSLLLAQIAQFRHAGVAAPHIYADAGAGPGQPKPERDKLLGLVQPGDTILLTHSSRLERDKPRYFDLLRQCAERGVQVRSLSESDLIQFSMLGFEMSCPRERAEFRALYALMLQFSTDYPAVTEE